MDTIGIVFTGRSIIITAYAPSEEFTPMDTSWDILTAIISLTVEDKQTNKQMNKYPHQKNKLTFIVIELKLSNWKNKDISSPNYSKYNVDNHQQFSRWGGFSTYISKLSPFSRGRPEGSPFNSYYTEV